MRFSAVAAAALLLCPDDSLLHVGGATETVAFPPSPVDQAAYQELLVSRMFGPANSRFEGMPRPPPPGAPLGYGRDLEAREFMAYSEFLAGMAFNNAGLGFVHAIAHQLGGFYNVSACGRAGRGGGD